MNLPVSFATAPPPGGVRARVRAPLPWAGKLASVTVGGIAWTKFDPAAETVDFSADDLKTTALAGLTEIIATFTQ
jgi:hypothetical protein